ncbi:MAG: homogentisate 1,2-dioxygenase [Endozoicomonadaceae bacterium]|nr:homogentisate 1,2-dioxygenase [Endozoicomonadaceae bacterium]
MPKHQKINIPIKEGCFTRQAHCDLPDNTYERELGREGFYGPVTHMLHQKPPTGWTTWEGPLKPHAFRLSALKSEAFIPWNTPAVLHNADVNIRFWQLNASMPALVRNSDGDDLIFVHEGEGSLFCDYGHLHFHTGDYLLIPRGTAWRMEVHNLCCFLLIENNDGMYHLPDKGLLGPQAIFDPAVLDYPRIDDNFKAQQSNQPWSIHIKRQQVMSKVTYPYNPLDAIGWHGTNTVFRLNWKDIRPLNSHRYHIPPSAHTTFVAQKFVVCTFCPRPVETEQNVLKVPFFHNNDDFDEVIFYHQGNFFSRDHIEKGMITFHPCGFTHGPHPKALQKSMSTPEKMANEVAVMIDTRRHLNINPLLFSVEDTEYVNSWKSPQQ